MATSTLSYIFVEVDAPLWGVAVGLKILKEGWAAVGVGQLGQVQLHVEETVHLGEQRPEQWHQEGVGLLSLLLHRAPQDALYFAQQVAGLVLAGHLLGLQDAVELGRSHGAHLWVK